MKETHGGDWSGFQSEYGFLPLDFSANVSPLGLPASVREAAVRALENADRYPDPLCRELRIRLAEHHGIPDTQVVCGNGAADLIFRICRALRPRCALLTAPDFEEYERALRAENCEIRYVARSVSNDFCLDPDHLKTQIDGAELLFLSNPNNPSGLITEKAVLRKILEICAEVRCVPVIDECFMDFTEHPEENSLIPELCRWPDLVILKAFTKTYAMAGLRLGYAICGSTSLAGKIQREGQPWPVSNVAQEAGLAALNEKDYVNCLRLLISRERQRMIVAMEALGLRVIPGKANYLLFQCGDGVLEKKLRDRGILIRDCGSFEGLSAGWFRVAVRTGTENDRLLRTLQEVL